MQTPYEFNQQALRDLIKTRQSVHLGMAELRATAEETLWQAYQSLFLADAILCGQRKPRADYLQAAVIGAGS